MTTRARFDIHVNSRATGIVHAADCVVEEDAGFVRRVDFRYTPRYLENSGRFPLDPARLPLAPREIRFRCQGGAPGFIDDHLPDAWGRKVLTALAHYRDGHRRHLVSVNALLKETGTQRDSGLPFRYDDIADLLTRHSGAVRIDLEQLARLALFNRAINNTDDHSRNFSLIHDGDCYRLSPAYDLVPSMAAGEYHAASFGYEPNPPRPSQVARAGRMFGLSKPLLRSCADGVLAAVERWLEFAGRAGVMDAEADRIESRFHP